MPIAVGFYLLALPLVVAIFLAEGAVGQWTNAAAAVVMIGCGFAVHRRAKS